MESQHELELKSDQSPFASRLADLVASDDVISDIDEKRCQSLLHDVQEDMKTLDNRIDEVERVLLTLRDIRERKAKQARFYRSVTSSVRRLPFEVLSKIFREACPTFTIGPHSVHFDCSLKTMKPPWTLTEVSVHWRQVAISIPELWSSIRITSDMKNKHLPLLHLQIHRSNTSLLTVVFHHVRRPLLRLLVAELLPSSSRWETLCLQDINIDCFDPIKGNLAALHTLLYHTRDRADPTTVFAVTPKLRTLYIYQLSLLDSLQGLPTSQITNLFTIGFSAQNRVGRLTRFSALEQCSLRLSIATRVKPIDVILPTLRMLELDVGDEDPTKALDQLTLPALQALKLCGKRVVAPLSSLLRRSQCALRDLYLYDPPMDAQEIFPALDESPSLECLTLDGVATETEIAIVTELAKRCDLIPSLQFLHFRWRGKGSSLLQSLRDARPQLRVLAG